MFTGSKTARLSLYVNVNLIVKARDGTDEVPEMLCFGTNQCSKSFVVAQTYEVGV